MANAPAISAPRTITSPAPGPSEGGGQPPTPQAADPVAVPVPTEASPAMIEETESIHASSLPHRDPASMAPISISFGFFFLIGRGTSFA